MASLRIVCSVAENGGEVSKVTKKRAGDWPSCLTTNTFIPDSCIHFLSFSVQELQTCSDTKDKTTAGFRTGVRKRKGADKIYTSSHVVAVSF